MDARGAGPAPGAGPLDFVQLILILFRLALCPHWCLDLGIPTRSKPPCLATEPGPHGRSCDTDPPQWRPIAAPLAGLLPRLFVVKP